MASLNVPNLWIYVEYVRTGFNVLWHYLCDLVPRVLILRTELNRSFRALKCLSTDPFLIREEERHIHTFDMLQTFLQIGSFFFLFFLSFFKSVFVKKASSFQRNSVSLHPAPTKARANVTLPRLKSIPGIIQPRAFFSPPVVFVVTNLASC